MQLVNIMMMPKRNLFFIFLFVLPFTSSSQDNSPYSRYGIGNLVPQGNVLNRGMGGISAGFSDAATVNYINPASYGNLLYTTLDIGAQIDSRVLKSTNPVSKFTSNNAYFSYLQVGVPLLNNNKKAQKKEIGWGLNFGLRPVSRISYKIIRDSRITNIDSIATLYEGSGGVNEAYIGTGLRIKDFSVGINAGYLFGNKSYSTRLFFINDTVNYLNSNSSTQTSFGGVFLNAGIQYTAYLKERKKYPVLIAGAYGSLKKDYSALQDIVRETFVYNSQTGAANRLDSVFEKNDIPGIVRMPATYGAGFTYQSEHWLYGADFETSSWSQYRFYNRKDSVRNSWMLKAGFQYFPNASGTTRYWNFVRYRAGIYVGPDYIFLNKKLPQFGVTVGAGFPLKIRRAYYETQYSVMNLGLEYGNRGNNKNNIRENIFRINLGFSLSDIWFRRYKYE